MQTPATGHNDGSAPLRATIASRGRLRHPGSGRTKLDQYQRRIAAANRQLQRAIIEYRDALEAGRRWSPDAVQDEVARSLLSSGSIWLPQSKRMHKAAAAGLPKVDPREKNDTRALEEMAYLVIRGEGLKPASRRAADLAPNPGGASQESVAHRLREKFREDRAELIIAADVRLRCELFDMAIASSKQAMPGHLSDRQQREIVRIAEFEARARSAEAVRQTVARLTRSNG